MISCDQMRRAALSICVADAFIWTRLYQPVRASSASPSASWTSLLLTRAESTPLACRAQMDSTATSRSISPW
ncbi:hypothetical protein BSY18_4135 (plasmid) [Blastomonas sp. RAC04]|nr:hypothetical protein BSY18_4135 [Blastomonas sp. RAC04]